MGEQAQRYRVEVSSDFLRFAAAHFIAFPGFRESLHGHNYQMSVRVDAALGADGYVIDFGVVKRVAEALCAELTERTLVPMRSDCLTIETFAGTVRMTTVDGGRFEFPVADCALLPIVHSSAEELAAYLLGRLRDGLAAEVQGRDIRAIAVGVAEAPGQMAWCEETV
jgi:dihydroneopterin triphosphate aldolase (PTPS-III) / 6-pyruvoyltetrahydropterin synthase